MLEGTDGIEEIYGQSWWYSPILHVTVNIPPNAPGIDGPESGKAGTSYEYGFTATDPDGDDIAEYIVDWCDGTGEEAITGPFASGEEAIASHTWAEKNTYIIKAKAKDIHDAESNWGYLEVTMPFNQQIYSQQSKNSLLLQILGRLLNLRLFTNNPSLLFF